MLDLEYALEFKNITMEFSGVKALKDMSFKVNGGEIVALLGENGAGKSTLLKILNGDYRQSSGDYFIDGNKCFFKSPKEAIEAGISIIYQERQVIEEVSVAENIFIGHLPTLKTSMIDYKKLYKDTKNIIDQFGIAIKPTDKVKDISIAHQQMVEVMKAYNRNIKIIAFDEPTASLSSKEVSTLFKIINILKEKGKIILYVSHRLKEIFEICDRVIVFKDGQYVAERYPKETNSQELVRLMVGRDLGDIFDSYKVPKKNVGKIIVEVDNLTTKSVNNVSFYIREGEVVGFAGLIGSGRTEVANALFGVDKKISGTIKLYGKGTNIKSIEEALSKGICMCPEDRKEQGIIPICSLKENISVIALKMLSKFGIINRKLEEKLATDSVVNLNIKTSDIHKKIVFLSGGNQQKAILSRVLAVKPNILILDEPTKGVDVGAKLEIYKIIYELVKNGMAILLISSELPEIIGVSTRIYVMQNSSIVGELDRDEASEEKILSLAMIHEK